MSLKSDEQSDARLDFDSDVRRKLGNVRDLATAERNDLDDVGFAAVGGELGSGLELEGQIGGSADVHGHVEHEFRKDGQAAFREERGVKTEVNALSKRQVSVSRECSF